MPSTPRSIWKQLMEYIPNLTTLGIRCSPKKNSRMVGLGWFLFPFFRETRLLCNVICSVRGKGLPSSILKEESYARLKHQKCKIIFSSHLFQPPDAQSFPVYFLKMKNSKAWPLSKPKIIFLQQTSYCFHICHIRIAKSFQKFRWPSGRT